MKKITSICLTIFLGVNIVSAYALVASNSLFYRKIFRLLPKEPNPRLPRVNFRQEMQ